MKFSQVMESLRRTIVFDSKDYSVSKKDAWVYGIIIGWDGPSMKNLREKFNWTDEQVARLRKLRAAWRAEELKHEKAEAS